MPNRTYLAAANWKMHKSYEEGMWLASEVVNMLHQHDSRPVKVVICPNATLLHSVSRLIHEDQENLHVGAQNIYYEHEGAFTGELSAEMIGTAGCSHVIVGHSERRAFFHEDDNSSYKKIKAALNEKLTPILCIGESLEDRTAKNHLNIISEQLNASLLKMEKHEIEQVVLAYEPVWAIGTGKSATTTEISEMHQHIRTLLKDAAGNDIATSTSILYGGSCSAKNAMEIFSIEDVDGGLVGGASLKSKEFCEIVDILKKSKS